MMSGVGEMVEFLLACIAEDEAVARDASVGRVWTWDGEDLMSEHTYPIGSMTGRECIIATEGANPPNPETAGAHIARHDPARVLRRCEADRRIVDTADRMILDADDPESEMSAKERFIAVSCAMAILRSLAAIYADHPGYREEWKP